MTSRSPIQLCYAWHQAECRVTITGADDKVDPKALVDLSERYPFVEWGILVSHKRVGTNRYPCMRWAREAAIILASNGCHFAFHLCGESRANYQSNRIDSVALVERLTQEAMVPTQCRIQLNGFDHTLEGFDPPNPFVPHILPVKSDNLPEAMGKKYAFNAQFLFDESGGRGVQTDPDLACRRIESVMRMTPSYSRRPTGFAGGLREDNIARAMKRVFMMSSYEFDLPDCWVDLESGVRTDDEFDMSKVETVLQAASKAFG